MKPGPCLERLFPIVRWKPNGVRRASNYQRLPEVENQESCRRINCGEFAISVSDNMQVRHTFKPFAHPLPTCRDNQLRRLFPRHLFWSSAEFRVRSDPEKSRLHRAGRDLKRLK